jgi:hypothetical protein
MKDKIAGPGLVVGCLFILVYGGAQLYAGFLGIQYHLGSGWAWGAITAAVLLRFPLPITIGAFFGAMSVWGWPWGGALVFAAPGLAFMAMMIPGAMASALGKGSTNGK